MPSTLGRLCAPIWIDALIFSLILAGCGQPVREDRSINWSREGESVGFQHGQEGIFVADKDGGKLTKIFQPGENIVATSTPLWSSVGRKAIFTTARAAQGTPRGPTLVVDNNSPDDTVSAATEAASRDRRSKRG